MQGAGFVWELLRSKLRLQLFTKYGLPARRSRCSCFDARRQSSFAQRIQRLAAVPRGGCPPSRLIPRKE